MEEWIQDIKNSCIKRKKFLEFILYKNFPNFKISFKSSKSEFNDLEVFNIKI